MRHWTRRLVVAMTATTLVMTFPAVGGASTRTVSWPSSSVRVSVAASRLGGTDRYATATTIAAQCYPGWKDVSHVVIASGATTGLADPLAAASLCWAQRAPLLLVSGSTLPSVTRTALEQIVSANTTVTVTIIGSSKAVTSACERSIAAIVGAAQVERGFAGRDRYETAALIAERVDQLASAETTRTRPSLAFVVNGTNAAGFYDALALSAVSAATGVPVLFTQKSSVPAATTRELTQLDPQEVIVGGGTAVVSNAVYSAVGAGSRWAGGSRYSTAVKVAEKARTRGWLVGDGVGLAATVPDALTGAILSGMLGDPLLFTPKSSLGVDPASYLESYESAITSATVYGGTAALSSSVFAQLKGTPAAAVITSPGSNGLVAKKARVQVKTGVNTSICRLYAGSTLVATKSVPSYGTVDFGVQRMPASGAQLRVVTNNPEFGTAEARRSVRVLSYPAATSIVVDKSDFKLYWVRNDVLVKTYSVAIGRDGMETPPALWKILAKYQTDPSGVYGPRKMRLYRKVGSSWVYSAYGIHGTNEPWVIGTKASHGCIRLHNADVLELYPQVPLGTIVQTRQ